MPSLREIARESKIGWLSPAVIWRLAFPDVLRLLPLPRAVKERAPVLRVVSREPRLKDRWAAWQAEKTLARDRENL